jgi:hypothetical protein
MNRLLFTAFVLVSIAFGGSATAQNISDTDLVSRVIKAKRTSDIPPQSLSNVDKMNFIMEIPARLFSITATTKDKERTWHAIHHFSSIADAGVSESFDIDCIEAMNKYPLIFYNRYMGGDDQALRRLDDALNADWTNGDDTDIKDEKRNRKAIENEINAIQAKKGLSLVQTQRSLNYLVSLQKGYDLRKKRFREVFGEIKID